jgi:16S rRNA (cytosine967-C5)-methyltransferase
MTRAEAYLTNALKIIDLYQGELPFALWLKDYFKANKKFGSTDRKRIAELCFLFFRASGLLVHFPHWSKQQCIQVAIGLIHSDPDNWACSLLDPSIQDSVHLPFDQKVERVIGFDRACLFTLFPESRFAASIPRHLRTEAFYLSMLHQPDMFLRVRPGRKSSVESQLRSANIPFQTLGDETVRLANGTQLDSLLNLDKEVVVQDLASQSAGEVVQKAAIQSAIQRFLTSAWRTQSVDLTDIPVSVWDCCAASGGKSIQLSDGIQKIKLTVSDIRISILSNLKKRFQTAGIQQYQSFVVDLEQPISVDHPLHKQKFDLIIADVPCSGSGTWSRTPEQLHFYDGKNTKRYQEKQRKIVEQAAQRMSENATLVYITCSVFTAENEEQVEYFVQKLGLRLVAMQYHTGFHQKADNLFTAVFTNKPAPPRDQELEKKLAGMDHRYEQAYKQSLLADNANRPDQDAIGKPEVIKA